jgi:L-fuconolactonase
MLPRPIIDTHVHLWDPTQLPRPWLADIPRLNQRYGLAEYATETTAINIAGIVFVETDVAPQFALLEAQFMASLAMQMPLLLGIIAAAPVEYGERTRLYFDALQRLGDTVKGVRRNLQDEQDNHFCLNNDFVRGVQLLATYDWTFDICIRAQQLPAIIALVRQCPDVRFVLDHVGKPPIREQQLDPWRDHLAELATFPNVWCKISGMVTEADPQHWHQEDLDPFLEYALKTFGPSRCMFGSDWPVLRLATRYQRWLDVVQNAVKLWDEAAQQAFWVDTAQQVYHLAFTGE